MALINRTSSPPKGLGIPSPGGENAQQASSVYHDFYGELPMPATAYATSKTSLHSLEVVPSVLSDVHSSAIVHRANDRQGMRSTGGRQSYETGTPQLNNPVPSSKFQDWLMGPQVNYSQNDNWYIAFPAATISLGTNRNLAWSERVPQVPTRTSGGPGPGSMRQAPRFKAVQTVPRYSTMPPKYPTASAKG